MKELQNITMIKSTYSIKKGTKNENANIVIFIYKGNADPKPVLDEAVNIYTNGKNCHQFIDANLDNPWLRVIMSDISNMTLVKFDMENVHLKISNE